MKVRLHKDGQKHFTKEEWNSIHEAFVFFIEEHKLDKFDTAVYVKFASKLDLSGVLGGFDIIHGRCITEFRHFAHKVVVERFIIEIAPGNFTKVIETIFHEMTHVLQELRGDIVRQYDGSEIYRGVHYSVDILKKPTYNEYRNFPWEIEACEVSKEMLKKWHQARGTKQTFWTKLINFWR